MKSNDFITALEKEFVFINAKYDEQHSIGKRYRRQDEAGTPFGITVDHDTLEDNSVTLRDRDTMKQIRVGIDKISDAIADQIK